MFLKEVKIQSVVHKKAVRFQLKLRQKRQKNLSKKVISVKTFQTYKDHDSFAILNRQETQLI